MKACDLHGLDTGKLKRARYRVARDDLFNPLDPPVVLELCEECDTKMTKAIELERFQLAFTEEKREGELNPEEATEEAASEA